MFFNFNDEVDIVKGAKQSLIVDVKNKIYMKITNKFYDILIECRNGKQIEKITNNTSR